MESLIQISAPFFSDQTLINRRNVTGDPKSSYRANRDFLHITFQSRVITAAMTVLGFADKASAVANYPLQQTWRKWGKLRN